MGKIIWLASYPKSGNTWLRIFLANYIANEDQPLDIERARMLTRTDIAAEPYEEITGKRFSELSTEEVERTRPLVHGRLAAINPDVIFVKTHNAMARVHGRPLITPSVTAGAIYLIRNPLDVVPSWANHLGVTIDRAIEILGEPDFILENERKLCYEVIGSWQRHYRSWMGAQGLRRYVMRYEDMLADPAKAFGDLLAFWAVPPDPQRLKKAVRFSAFEELAKQEREKGFGIKAKSEGGVFFRKGRIGSWREALSKEQAERVIAACREVMIERGYLDENGKPTF